MGKNTDDRPAYLSSDDAKYSLGVHRGPLAPTSEDPKLEQVQSAGGISLATNRSRKERLARHWKRFWCCYLIGNVIFLAIFLPVFFLVAIPAISQLVVNKSDLVLVNAAVMQPRAESIQLTLESALNLKIALPVRIEPIVLDLFVRDTGSKAPWGNVTIAGKTIKGNTTLGVSDVHTPLINTTTWTSYVHDVVFDKTTALSLRGTTNSYLGVLKSPVVMDKDVVSPTLDSFNGFSITDSALLLPPKADGTNLVGNATLPNPSVLTIEIGTITLDIKSGGLVIGNATLEDLTIKPGDNKHPLTAILDFDIIFAHLGTVLKSQANLLKTGNLTLDTITKSVVWENKTVPYYTEVMSGLTLPAQVPLMDTLKNTLHGLNLTELADYAKSNSTGGGLLSTLENDFKNMDSGSGSGSGLSSLLKRNVHIREALKNIHPVKRDAALDSLANLYMKL
ncbi:uncharacterized protein N7477_007172 [Penicillium maclennaniae]|uniref:uncharacterized protein n=1 Tax=Penicillium maclennaniae TaxID=1343394 RepID=UPI002541BBC8|nr:uncharacterized protein N7477_007172 [Penicillium maclennaniae]KAJ5668602.1 hypothetical protein N7477_007172 [Penicillium maclennaniae]